MFLAAFRGGFSGSQHHARPSHMTRVLIFVLSLALGVGALQVPSAGAPRGDAQRATSQQPPSMADASRAETRFAPEYEEAVMAAEAKEGLSMLDVRGSPSNEPMNCVLHKFARAPRGLSVVLTLSPVRATRRLPRARRSAAWSATPTSSASTRRCSKASTRPCLRNSSERPGRADRLPPPSFQGHACHAKPAGRRTAPC